MATAACGIDCGACKLYVDGICSTCGPGTSTEGMRKAEAQKRLFGQPCPILECARMNHIEHCTRDCALFPCENFEAGPYPYSIGFLKMQQRRRTEDAGERKRDHIDIPPEFWDDLGKKDVTEVCNAALATPLPEGDISLKFLNEDLLVDIKNKSVMRFRNGSWDKTTNTMLELVVLVYLLNVTYEGITNDIIGLQDLKEAHFFQGPHELRTGLLLERYGRDPEGFKKAAENLGGKPADMADTAYRLSVFPKVPLYFLLWVGDDEFEPNLSVLFDRSVERHLSADAIWGLVNLVSGMLAEGPEV